jgi:hypothetical protein
MSHSSKREYLIAIYARYKSASKNEKSIILTEFCSVCNLSRKYAIRLLKSGLMPRLNRPGPRIIYDPKVLLKPIEWLWGQMGEINSKKMQAALPEWLEFIHTTEASPLFTIEAVMLLEQISASSLERLLKFIRQKRNKGLSGTRPAKKFLSSVPIQAKDWNVTAPGTVQADTVAHCGTTLLGSYAHSITVTDIFSGWTENRSIWTKGQESLINQMFDIEETLPFLITTFKSDNGTEFMNHRLMAYFNERNRPVKMVRSRPYKKDDNCYVEQKNFTHVRELFLYDRIDNKELVEWMNEIYKEIWNPLQNFFIPSTKLLRKTRVGSRIKKQFEKAKTPYQRIMDSDSVTQEQKEKLKAIKESLNPFNLNKALDLEIRSFFQAVRYHRYPAAS